MDAVKRQQLILKYPRCGRFVLVLLLALTSGSCGTAPRSASGLVPKGGNERPPNPALPPLPDHLPRYRIEVDGAAQARLEADPWKADDVAGTFEDEAGLAVRVELNYRGAFALQNLINAGPARNWKVKFPKESPLLNRREWNFNRETHLRHKLAYDLMSGAGVRVPSAEYVLLTVNGEDFGMYLRYEDPDNKAWVSDLFGDASGDLFKAAYDVPNEPKYFALLTVLGATDEDYFLHYNKKLNNEGPAETDFINLRLFIDGLNETPTAELEDWLTKHFDVDSFINYLVVSNFISNWDSYPERPKNYWLYQGPLSGRWFYVPWDMDATFQTQPSTLAPMGPEVSIFHSFDRFEPNRPNSLEEGTERPLVRRMMALDSFRKAYVERYKALTTQLLAVAPLETRIEELTALCAQYVSTEDLAEVEAQSADIREYVERRAMSVREQLAAEP